jgi:hypothetical protein
MILEKPPLIENIFEIGAVIADTVLLFLFLFIIITIFSIILPLLIFLRSRLNYMWLSKIALLIFMIVWMVKRYFKR